MFDRLPDETMRILKWGFLGFLLLSALTILIFNSENESLMGVVALIYFNSMPFLLLISVMLYYYRLKRDQSSILEKADPDVIANPVTFIRPSGIKRNADAIGLTQQRAEELVEDAMNELPSPFKERLKSIAVIVQELPGKETHKLHEKLEEEEILLGLFVGVPISKRSLFYEVPCPDLIYIYYRNIESVCHSEEEIKKQIYLTVYHEIGHHFGLLDQEMP